MSRFDPVRAVLELPNHHQPRLRRLLGTVAGLRRREALKLLAIARSAIRNRRR